MSAGHSASTFLGLLLVVGLSKLLHRLRTCAEVAAESATSPSTARLCLDDALCLFIPPIAWFLGVSSQNGFTIFLRYIIPCYPFAFIGISLLAANPRRWVRAAVWPCLAASALSAFIACPDFIGFFNWPAGGSRAAHRHLLHANCDFGQNGYYLRDWLRAHPDTSKTHIDLYYPLPLFALEIEQTDYSQAEWLALCQTRLWGHDDKYIQYRSLIPRARLPGGICIFRKVKSDPTR